MLPARPILGDRRRRRGQPIPSRARAVEQFEYLAVLISIVLGLGITQLLSGFGRWLEQRDTFRAYAPSILWAAILLVLHVQTWWSMFSLRHQPSWTFLQFSVVLLQPIILFLLTTLVLPSAMSPRPDLRANYFAQRTWFFGLIAVLLLVSLLKDIAMSGVLPDAPNLAFHTLFIVLSATAMIVERERIHIVMSYAAGMLVAAYISLLFAVLR
jgi:hypothetical protein